MAQFIGALASMVNEKHADFSAFRSTEPHEPV
jgi:hypothetical protein